MAYSPYERQASHPAVHANQYAFNRPHLEPPRPLEPRPTLHTSLSDSSGIPRRPEAFRSPVSADLRSQHQTLPGLRDILASTPPASGSPSYSTWNVDSSPQTQHHRSDSQYNRYGPHPPMALQPNADHHTRYQPHHARYFDVPILDTNPVAQHPTQALQPSPYSSYPDPSREYSEIRLERQPQPSHGSYMTNGMPSPYATSTPSEVEYRSPVGMVDRNAASPYAPTSAENQKKYLGVKDVPGEGAYHFYEGGHRIPTQVDGEQVNPAWGLTKANKPRKRLALACLDCREKKIKCEPGADSCLQCEKAKRTCRKAPNQSNPNDSSAPWPGLITSPSRKGASVSDPTPLSTRDTDPDPLNKRRERADPSPPNVPSKKHRSASPVSTIDDGALLPKGMVPQPSVAPVAVAPPPQSSEKGLLTWEDDPCATDPDTAFHLLNLYFAHVNNAAYCMYPRAQFLSWARTSSNKCQNERMLLYSMLAVGSIFAHDDFSSIGKRCARVAGDAVATQTGRYNLALVQTNLLLGLFSFSKNSNGSAWDYLGTAERKITYLSLHTEHGCLTDADSMANPRLEFDFSREQLAECKRRTFWSCFLMCRYGGSNVSSVKPHDVFLRLPCTDDMYERSVPSDAPYFENDIIDPAASILTPSSPLAPMAWLVAVTAIWGDVVDFVFRAPYRATDTYLDVYESFYDNTGNRLQGWYTRLPDHLQYSEVNLERSIQQGFAGTFISMHALYHISHMKMNRCLRHSVMRDYISRNIRAAHSHGHQMLRMVNAIRLVRKEIVAPAEGQPPVFSFSTPFPGYATLTAIDITGAGGSDSNLGTTLDEIDGGLVCLHELSTYWATAKAQAKACERRYHQIKNLLTHGSKAQGGAWLRRNWGIETPLERDIQPEEDCIWGLGDSKEAIQMYFNAFNEEASEGATPQGGLRIV